VNSADARRPVRSVGKSLNSLAGVLSLTLSRQILSEYSAPDLTDSTAAAVARLGSPDYAKTPWVFVTVTTAIGQVRPLAEK
jgi:hypothetical protein